MDFQIAAVHRVARHDQSTSYEYLVQFTAEHNRHHRWKTLEEFTELNRVLGENNAAIIEEPDLKNAFVLVDARRKVASDLEKAAKSNMAVIEDFLRLLEKGNNSDGEETSSAPPLPVSKAIPLAIKRARARTASQILAESVLNLRKKIGFSSSVALVLGFFLLAVKRYKGLRQTLFGSILGMAGALAIVEFDLKKTLEPVISEAGSQSKANQTTFSSDLGADKSDIQRLKDLIEQEACPEEDGAVNAEDKAKELEDLFVAVDELDAQLDHMKALDLLQPHMSKLSSSFELMWRVARTCYYVADIHRRKSNSYTDPKRIELLETALEITEDMIERFPRHPLSHKYYAICAQEFSNHQGTKEKIIAGKEFFEHTLIAIELDNQDPTLHFMLGKFNFEVAKLSWAERMAAKAIFGQEPPKTTYQEALQCFTRAKELRTEKPELMDTLEIAKCHIKLKDYSTAKKLLESIIKSPPSKSTYDQDARAEAIEQIKSC